MPSPAEGSPTVSPFAKRAGIALILCALLTAAGLVFRGLTAHARKQSRIDRVRAGGVRAVLSLAELGTEIAAEYEKAQPKSSPAPQASRTRRFTGPAPIARGTPPRVFRRIDLKDLDIPPGLKVIRAQVLITRQMWIVAAMDPSKGPQNRLSLSGGPIDSPDRRVQIIKGDLYENYGYTVPVMSFQTPLKVPGSRMQYAALIVVELGD